MEGDETMAAIKKRYAEAQARGDTAAMKSAHADARRCVRSTAIPAARTARTTSARAM